MTLEGAIALENPVFTSYLFYCSVLILKMLFMSIWTGRQRYINRFVHSSEPVPPGQMEDPDVERVRRAHRNDLENIYAFTMTAFVYTLTKPNAWLAIHLMKAYTCARIAHTLVYAVVVVPQPARGLAWGIAFVINAYMVIASVIHFASAV